MLDHHNLPETPVELFDRWLADAGQHPDIKEPTAMSLATGDDHGNISCRIVLLKDHNLNAFTFYTNHSTSRKSKDIQVNPKAALCFYWMPLDRQVRLRGSVTRVEDAAADAYFASRPRGSQIGAWASAQSEEVDSRHTLEERIAAYEQKYAGRDIPRPPHWHGWSVKPDYFEFWEARDFRLHDRFIYSRQDDDSWTIRRLNP